MAWNDKPPAEEELQWMQQPPEKVDTVQPDKKPSMMESAGRGALQGVTLGFGEEIGSAASAPVEWVASKLFQPSASQQAMLKNKTPVPSILDLYRETRDETRQRDLEAAKEHPLAFLGGEIAGGLAAPIPGLGKGKAAAKIGKMAAMGGVAGAGLSKADVTKGEVGQLGKDVGKGAVTSAVLGTAFKGLSKIPEMAKKTAIGSSTRALGYKMAQLSRSPKVVKTAKGAEGASLAKAKEVGEEMLDKGMIKGSSEKMMDRITRLKEEAGETIGAYRQNLGDKGVPGIEPFSAADEVERQLSSNLLRSDKHLLEEVVDDILGEGYRTLDIGSSHKLVKLLQAKGKFKPNMSPTDAAKTEMYRRASGILSDMLDEQVGKHLPSGNMASYLEAKRLYGLASEAQAALIKKTAREYGNEFPGLTNIILGAGRLGAGDIKGAMGAMGMWELVKRYGAQGVARLANMASKTPKAIIPGERAAKALTVPAVSASVGKED